MTPGYTHYEITHHPEPEISAAAAPGAEPPRAPVGVPAV
jgi:hypothetical protein